MALALRRAIPLAGAIVKFVVSSNLMTPLFLGTFCVLLSGQIGASDDYNPRNFINDYRGKVKNIQDYFEVLNINGNLSEQFFRPGDANPAQDRKYRFSYSTSNDYEKMIQVKETPQYFEQLLVVGPHRKFVLRRDSADVDYAISQLGELPDGYNVLLSRRRNAIGHVLCSLGEVGLQPLVNSSDFKVRKVTRLTRAGRPFLKVEFDYNPNVRDQFNTTGWFILDLEQNWVVDEYEVRNTAPHLPGWGQIAAGNIRYRPGREGWPVPIEITQTERNTAKSNALVYRLHFQTEAYSRTPVPTREFTLAAYGFAELDRPAGRRTNRVAAWALGTAGLAFTLSYVLKRLSGARRA